MAFASLFQFRQKRVQASQERLFLGFDVADQSYALEVASVREIVRIPRITTYPQVPSFVKGVMDLRGQIIPVLDLKERLGLGKVDVRKGRAVIMLPGGSQPLGLLVDAATEVFPADPENVLPPPEALRQPQLAFIEAVLRASGRLYYLLKPGGLLKREEFQAFEACDWSAAKPS